jgi:enediyne biosynthesis protein E4
VRWPSGRVEHLTLPAVDRFYSLEEGKGIVPGVYDPKPGTSVSADSPHH